MHNWKLLKNHHCITCLFHRMLLEEDLLFEVLDDLELTEVVDYSMLLLEESSGV